MAGIVKLLENEISGTVSNVDLDNVFSDTYDVYMIKGVNIGVDTDNKTLQMRLIQDDGDVDTNGAYNTAKLLVADFSTTIDRLETVDQTQFYVSRVGMGTGTDEYTNIIIYLFNTRVSGYTNILTIGSTLDYNADFKLERGQGYHERTETIRGVRFLSDSGVNLDNGKFVVYGFKKS